ncbi:unnamed protein product [Spodoptera littoralis]|uniref:Uncharacterized protein n=1 Tax=Spodoptera littoralis TaxID=7109 RepID=A0A9P0IA08_SPOLI|nr:unnamed protein product [Spodoptera littoralis]CAH1643809.1 unnamed protein product [Spodoptera littoralis]
MLALPRTWLTLVFCNVILWNVSYAQYQSITAGKIRLKLTSMTRELVLDACQKIAAIQSYRREYARAEVFQMGDMIHYMRSTFKKMTKVYQLTDEYYYIRYDEGWFLKNLQELTLQASMVDTMLNIIKEGTAKKETSAMLHARMQRVLRSGKKRPRAPRQPSPPSASSPPRRTTKRRNQKWRHVVDNDFVQV